MRILFLLPVISLFLLSCQSKQKERDVLLSSSDVSETAISDIPTEDKPAFENPIYLSHEYYMSAVKTAKDSISLQDFSKFKLKEFTRLKYGEDQFRYYLLKEFSFYPSFRTCLIAEYYDSETAAWLVNYSPEGSLLDAYEVYYDNAEGFYTKTAKLDIGAKSIKIEEHNIYENPEDKNLLLMVTEKGKIMEDNLNKQHTMRSIQELIDEKEPGIELVKEWAKDAKNKIEILPRSLSKAEEALYNTQVTTRSPMGAIVYETGGILIDNGWLRILGSGHEKLDRSLPEWNKGKSFNQYGEQPAFLLVADDVLGGFFALNGGGISTEHLGKVFYFAPDTCEWESTEKGYSDFIYWCFHGDLNLYYKSFFWTGYEKDLAKIKGTEVFNFYPPLWSKEASNIDNCDRRIIPIEEFWDLSYGNRG